MAGQTGPRIAGQGNYGGRMRNTMANLTSHKKIDYKNPGGSAALPALSPAQTANYYQGLSGLYGQYQTTLTGLKLQRKGLRADFREARKGIQAEKITALASQENQSIERGILGSSAELQERTGIRAAASGAIAGARSDMLQGIAQNRVAAQQAAIDYQQGATALEANMLAAQQEALAQQLQANLIISGQEAQADAMKAIYESLAGLSGGGGRRRRRRRNAGDRPDQYTYGDPYDYGLPGGFYG